MEKGYASMLLSAITGSSSRRKKPTPASHGPFPDAQSHEAYRLARRDRPGEAFQPHGYSGDSAVLGSHDLMNRRARDLARNTPQGRRIGTALVDLVIGTGMQTFAWPFAPSEMLEMLTELESLVAGELGPRLSYALESDDLFEQWSNDPHQFDVEGRLSWPQIQRMMLGETANVGASLLIRSFASSYETVPLQYQLLEREQLDESQDRAPTRGKNRILGGKELDSRNRVVAYHVYLDHPHEFFGVGQSALLGAGVSLASGGRRARIPAERVIDLAEYRRPSETLGATWLDASGQPIWDRDAYMDSEIRTAAAEARLLLVAKLKDAEQRGSLGFNDEPEAGETPADREFRLGYSPVAATIDPEESIELIKAARPNRDAPPFIRLLDTDIAAANGISYFTLTGDYTGANFTSTRGAKLDEEQHIKPLQQWFATHVALRVRREFNAAAAAMGLFKSVTPAEFLRNRGAYQRFDAIGAGRDLLDPFKEGEARTTALRTCLSTYKEECAKRGKHWIRTLMQIAVERKVSSLLGVTLDFTKGGGTSQPTHPAGDPAASEEQADDLADRIALRLEEVIRAA